MKRRCERAIVAGLVAAAIATAAGQDRTPTPPAPGTPPDDPYLLLVPPREPDPGAVRWSSNLETALLEARVRNLPVFLLCGNDTSPIMQSMVDTVYQKPSFAAINDQAIPVVAMAGLHHPAEQITEGSKKYRLC